MSERNSSSAGKSTLRLITLAVIMGLLMLASVTQAAWDRVVRSTADSAPRKPCIDQEADPDAEAVTQRS